MQLQDSNLLRTRCYLAGKWLDADSGTTVDVRNPATGQKLGTVPRAGAAETRRAIDAAAAAMPAWARKTAKERAAILRRWHDLMMGHQDDLATIMTAEQGKPLAESTGEIAYAAAFIEWFGEEGKRLYGDVIPGHQPDKRIIALRQPVGVVAAITPWNFPAAMIARKAGPALAAGCTFVCKPATQTPHSALAMAELGARAGIPAGVLNVITGDAAAIGGEMTSNPTVRKLTFTGSTEIGKKLMAQCAGTLKKLSLELGGNAPFIVFADADLDAAVQGAIASKYRNTGQTCVCANRLLVQTSIYDAFTYKLIEAVKALRVGDGLQGATDQGPLIDTKALAKVEEHIADAVSKGAKVVLGGKRHSLGGTFFEPTVVTHVTSNMLMAREETFGPVAPLFRFNTEEEAIRMANDTPFGLAAYFYTRDLARSWRVSEALEYGIVGLNTGIISTEVAPFGGIKESGFGREGSKYGILDYTEIKYVCVCLCTLHATFTRLSLPRMSMRNTTAHWGCLAQGFHWIIVALIITQFVLATIAHDLPLMDVERGATIARHKSIGITILMLAALRLLWRWMNPVPTLPATLKPWERAAARFSHAALYVLLFLQPLSGWAMSSARNSSVSWFGILQLPDFVPPNRSLYEFFHDAHEWLATALIVVATVHILAALRHHFILKNDVLRRMLPFTKTRSEEAR